MAAAAVDVQLTMPDSNYDASSLFSSSELEALDGFLASQLVAGAGGAGSSSGSGSSTVRTSAAHPSSSSSLAPESASFPTSFLPSYRPPVLNGSSHLPSVISTSGSNSFFAFPDTHESSAQREARLRNQADELASWFSRAQQAQGQQYQAASSIASTSYNTQQLWPPSDYSSASVPFGVRPSSATSTSNSESLSTPYGSFNAPSIQANSYQSSLAPSFPLSRPPELDSETSDSIHDQSFTQPPQAKRARTSFSVQEGPVPSPSTIEADVKPTTARGRSKARSGSSASTSVKKPKVTSTSSRRRSSAAKSAPLKPEAEASPPAVSPTPAPPTASGPKSALTEEQKRANHILSEQKRRTAIRNAYDELCTIVPALKAAISEYNDRLSKIHGPAASTSSAMSANMESAPATVAGVLTGGIEVGGEKIDGRAGPKSEAVVLGKTVDYLTALLEDREDLLQRLSELQKQAIASKINLGTSAAAAANAPWNKKWSSSSNRS